MVPTIKWYFQTWDHTYFVIELQSDATLYIFNILIHLLKFLIEYCFTPPDGMRATVEYLDAFP